MLAGATPGASIVVPQTGLELGRDEPPSFGFVERSLSRRHARIERLESGICLVDLFSKNGTFLNGERVVVPVRLVNGDRIQLGNATILRFSDQDLTDAASARAFYGTVVRDERTGTYSRKYFMERLRVELAYATVRKASLGVLVFEIDDVEPVFRAHGKRASVRLFRELSSALARSVRTGDIVGRVAGTRIAVLTRDVNAAELATYAKQLTTQLESLSFDLDVTHAIANLRVGFALRSERMPYSDPVSFLTAASRAL